MGFLSSINPEESSITFGYKGSAERKLLIAMLHRAVLDLSSKYLIEVRDALDWFQSTPDDTYYSYRNLLEILSLSSNEIKELDRYIAEGEAYLESAKAELKVHHIPYKSSHTVDTHLFLTEETLERCKRRVRSRVHGR